MNSTMPKDRMDATESSGSSPGESAETRQLVSAALVKVVWSDRALRSLADIRSQIAADSESAAHLFVDSILKRDDRLGRFPRLGRNVTRYDAPEIRELIETPYRIVYRIRGESVHGSVISKARRLNASRLFAAVHPCIPARAVVAERDPNTLRHRQKEHRGRLTLAIA